MMEELHENNDFKCDTLPSVSSITVLNNYHAVNNYYIDSDTKHISFH